jgi:hypothetical protein
MQIARMARSTLSPYWVLGRGEKGDFGSENLREVEVDYDQAGKKEARQSDASMVIAHPRL